jgi:hypothetical protein
MITAGSQPDGQLASCAVQRQAAQQARLDDLQGEGVIALSFPGHLPGVGGTGECLGADNVWVSRVGRKYLEPGTLAPAPWSLDADALHR